MSAPKAGAKNPDVIHLHKLMKADEDLDTTLSP